MIVLILLLSAFLRLYNLPDSFVFAGDEESQAILAQSIIKNFHVIWIGVNAAHLGFFLGPFWTYFTAFWLWISKGDPLITGYVSSLIGVFTTFFIIFAGSIVFNKRIGILTGLLYSTLPLMVFFDQKYWNPTLTPLLSLIMFFSLYELRKKPEFFILFSIAFGLVFHTHLSLMPIIFIAIFWIIKKRISIPKKVYILSLLSFLIIIAPLIIFDYFHKGTNIQTPLRFNEISSQPENRINPAHHTIALFQTLGRIWYLKPFGNNTDEVLAPCAYSSRTDTTNLLKQVSTRFNPPILLSLFSIFIIAIFFVNKSTFKKDNTFLISLFIPTLIVSFLFFPGAAFEYYLLGLFPLLLFIPSILAEYFSRFKKVITFFVLLVSCLGIFTILTNNPTFGFVTKQKLIREVISKLGDEKFELKQSGICHSYEAWRYLFVLNGKTPERSDSDMGLGWYYQSEITKEKVKYKVIMSEKRIPFNLNPSSTDVFEKGGFKSYVFEVVD